MHAHAVALEFAAQDIAGFRDVLRQQVVPVHDQVDLAAESTKGLSQFASHRPTAEHQEPPRELGQ